MQLVNIGELCYDGEHILKMISDKAEVLVSFCMVFPSVLLCEFLKIALPGDLSLFKTSNFHIPLAELLISTCTYLFQNFSFHYVVGHPVGYLVVQPCTCKK